MTRRSPQRRGPRLSDGNRDIIPNPAFEVWVLAERAALEAIRSARYASLERLNILPRHPMTFEECRRVVLFVSMVERHYREAA